jgi:hypothetical protein
VLVEELGVSDDVYDRAAFVIALHGDTREYRIAAGLGFGGKFRHEPTHGRLGRSPIYVDCYPEDETERRRTLMARTNARLCQVALDHGLLPEHHDPKGERDG